jgi:hypothetical protein
MKLGRFDKYLKGISPSSLKNVPIPDIYINACDRSPRFFYGKAGFLDYSFT